MKWYYVMLALTGAELFYGVWVRDTGLTVIGGLFFTLCVILAVHKQVSLIPKD